MTRLQKRLKLGYPIGNDRAVEIYENVMKKIPELDNLLFAPIENLWSTFSTLRAQEWLDTTNPLNVEDFHAWILEEVE